MKNKGPSVSFNGVPVELSEDGFLGITYWALHYPHTPYPKFRVYMYLGKVINDYHTYAFIERQGSDVIFKKFEELNTDLFKPFLLNMEKVQKEMDKYS